jgi:uncharacterized MAPEG superfamily protein
MRTAQRKVAVGAATGVLTMLAALFALAQSISGLSVGADAGERLAYAAQWTAIAAAPLFFAIVAVGNARFKSEAIDPTAGKESPQMIINGRVVDNTVQQYALFVAASFAVAAAATGNDLGVVGAAALIFVFMRFLFWIGYRMDPLYRAFGMAGTSYLNVALFGYAIWLAWS